MEKLWMPSIGGLHETDLVRPAPVDELLAGLSRQG